MSDKSVHTGYTNEWGQWIERDMTPETAFDADKTPGGEPEKFPQGSVHQPTQDLYINAATGEPEYHDKPASLVAQANDKES